MGYGPRKEFDLNDYLTREGERTGLTWRTIKDALVAQGYPADRVDAAAVQLACAQMQAAATRQAGKKDGGGRGDNYR